MLVILEVSCRHDFTGDDLSYSTYRCPTAESSIKDQTCDVPDDNTTIVGDERFCFSEVLFHPRFIGSEPAESTALSRSTCTATSCCQVARSIHLRRDSRTVAQLHQNALLWARRISWLCPGHDLKLFTCFCVSPCRKFVEQNLEGQPVFRSLHVCDVHHSLHRNGSIWYGLEDLSCIPSFLSSRCGSQRRVR